MKSKIIVFLLIGAIALSLALFSHWFFSISEDLADFLKGFGFTLIVSAMIILYNDKRKQGKTPEQA